MSSSASEFALRPRFLPDRDALREWGSKGASVVRLIRKGFAVPPSAAMGLTQVHEWLRGFPEYGATIESAHASDSTLPERVAALRARILSAPMPEHWTLSASTLRSLLCGDRDDEVTDETLPRWPMILRASANDVADGVLADLFKSVQVKDTSAEGLWDAFRQVVASGFNDEAFSRLKSQGIEPTQFRLAVLIHPFLVAEKSGTYVSAATSELSSADPFFETLKKRARKAESILGGPVALDWLWDGEQLWFLRARRVALPAGTPFKLRPWWQFWG